MYSMKEACSLTDMTYENLKFYCNEGLVPNVKRDSRNYRVFRLSALVSIPQDIDYPTIATKSRSKIPPLKDLRLKR